jgi:hypothetical protein
MGWCFALFSIGKLFRREQEKHSNETYSDVEVYSKRKQKIL